MSPLLESDLIFSSASTSLRTTLAELKRSNLSITNRLHSIKSDSDFVLQVADAYRLPLVANERCGSWYIPTPRKAGSAYFKSTDGHFGQWSFSLRRLNVQLLDLLGRHGGCVVVDSTRRGKSMPDALSKTIPVWVAVMNRLLFPADPEAGALKTPEDVVSASEAAQMDAKLDEFTRDVKALALDLQACRDKLRHRPVDTVWQRPGDTLPDRIWEGQDTNLIVLCTASNQTSNVTSATSDYVQGAADDSENWALGLTASTFWQNTNSLLPAREDDLPEIIGAIVARQQDHPNAREATLVPPTCNLWIGNNLTDDEFGQDFDIVVSCNTVPEGSSKYVMEDRYVCLQCTTGKIGSRQLKSELNKLQVLRTLIKRDSKILITCQTGKDMAVGVTLAILCRFYHNDGRIVGEMPQEGFIVNKPLIKQRLSWIMVAMPDAAPSRATLQSVNAYLMG